ncbi:MAG: ParB/RepB/Spo0J family partition protein [Clostridia bacterium]|nr:ParB/RepB/Spo0J family partition protein [Clostridia bacterium]
MAQKKKGLGRGLDDIFLDTHSTETSEGGITMVRIGDVEPNADQPRKTFDQTELAALAESITNYGMIQPITARIIDGGIYQIVTGERRWRAARLAGLTEVPVIVITADDKKAAEMALVENIQRSDLNPIEEALGYAALIKEHGLTQDEAAKRVGKSRVAVTNALRLLNLPENVRKMVEEGDLSSGHAKVLLGLNDKEKMEDLANQVIIRDLSVRDTERLIKLANEPVKTEPVVATDVDHTRALETMVQQTLGRTVKISEKGKKRSITIGYSDNEDLEALLKLLCGEEFLKKL